tara:strand:+ start:37 stop:402 length:366 start_codon:yes stop_codon:yes gene_type:complete
MNKKIIEQDEMNYFLITDHNEDGEHEYYDKVLVKTTMTAVQLNADHKDWQQNFLAWQFGSIFLSDKRIVSIYDWWSDNRLVSIYDWKQVPKKDFDVLDKHIGSFSLEQIIKDGEETFEDNE